MPTIYSKTKRLLLAGLLFSTAIAQAQLFKNGQGGPYADGGSPIQVAVGDFNNDGRPDFATTNYSTNSVTVFLQKADGSGYTLKGTVTNLGTNPVGIAVGDFNLDGNLDLALTSGRNTTGQVFVLLGDGNGNFTQGPGSPLNNGNGAGGIAVADFNGDGFPDILALGQSANLFLGNGHGGFSGATALATTNQGNVVAGDLNGDGKLDLVITSSSNTNVTVLLGNGNGIFSTAPGSGFSSRGTGTSGVRLGDFNNDGKLDLFVANQSSATVALFQGNGDGSFVAVSALVPTGSGPTDLAVADFNRDGNLDLAVLNYNDGTISAYFGNGNAGFAAASGSPFAFAGTPQGIVAKDMNNDQEPDLVVANSSGSVSVLLNGLPKAFFSPPQLSFQARAGSTTVLTDSASDIGPPGPINDSVDQPWLSFGFGGTRGTIVNVNPTGLSAGLHKGHLRDSASSYFGGVVDVSLSLANQTAGFALPLFVPSGTAPEEIATGDFNGDGKLDMAVVGGLNGGSLTVLLGDGTGHFTQAPGSPYIVGSGNSSVFLAVGDFNNDGKLDVVVVGQQQALAAVALGRGDGTFIVTGITAMACTGAGDVHTGDFNQDGNLDVVVGCSNTAAVVLLGDGFGGLAPMTRSSGFAATGTASLVTGDFNNDGLTDVAAVIGGGILDVYLGNGDATFTRKSGAPFNFGTSFAHIAAGDLNADGNQDLVISTINSSTNSVGVLLGKGDGTFNNPTYLTTSPAATGGYVGVTIADLDGDGNLDIAAISPIGSGNGSVLTFFLGNGTGTFPTTTQNVATGGKNGTSIVLGDFNGDNRIDLATPNFSDNNVGIYMASAPGTPTFSIQKTHQGNFQQGQLNATYTIVVQNTGNGAIPAGPIVQVFDTLPTGLTIVSISGTGWICQTTPSIGCNRGDGLAAGGTFNPITVKVNVAANAPASVTNMASVSGGGASNSPSISDQTTINPVVVGAPVWSITKTHTGTFSQNQQGAAYQITVSNTGNANATTAHVVENLPAGLTLVSMNGGQSWQCSNNTCDLNPALSGIAPGGSSQITVLVNVASNAPSPVTNSATVSGGGAASSATAMDSTNILQAQTSPQWGITKSHTGNFSQGQQNAVYTITVSNTGNATQTQGTVTETLPSGLTLASMTGNGWTCQNNICNLSPGVTIPAGTNSTINVRVNVASNAAASLTNQVTVSSPGVNSATANDQTTITPVASGTPQWSILESHTGNFTQGQTGAASTIMVTNTGTGPTAGQVTVTANPPSGFTTTSTSGTGWTCSCLNTCTRSDALAAGQSYPPITLTFNIASNTASNVNDMATVLGGGVSMSAVANDPIAVNQNTAPPQGPPIGSFDTPASNSNGSGSVAFTGWALEGTGITKVDLWREPNPGEAPSPNGLSYIGDANLVRGARPDVQAAFPGYPGNDSAGWGYLMLTNFLPSNSGNAGLGNGTYKIHAIAHGVDGLTTDLGSKTLIVDNAHSITPFGAIDTPTQGGDSSGMYANFGWALTPVGKSIPIDGSTITVLIDNAPAAGHPVYNQFRADVATLFPGYANSQGAIGAYIIDTTKLTNGRHTIAWLATDTAGQTGSIGSRYFNVQNACTAQ